MNIEIFPFDFGDDKLVAKAIDLLNEGSKTGKHNLDFWNWRFRDNPFGQSLGWYAQDMQNNELASILLWWPWKFTDGSEEKLFYQAINGKTAEQFRNQKVFYRLNTISIDYFQKRNSGLFGFANENSHPGYVKLGWKTIISVCPLLIPVSPVRSFLQKIRHTGPSVDPNDAATSEIINFRGNELSTINQVSTGWNNDIIDWRFRKHPLHNYEFYNRENNLIVYRMKKRGKFREAQIVFTDLNPDFNYAGFLASLRKQNIDFYSYFGLNTLFSEIARRQLFKYKLKKNLYFIVNDLEKFYGRQLRFEMADADSQ